MSLPYPSMTFVPLDILTAEEMNQIVANIESLDINVVDNYGRMGMYFPNGILITKRRAIKQNVPVNTQWGNLYRGVISDFFTLAPTGEPDFVEAPIAQINLTASGTSSIMQASWADTTPTKDNNNNRYAIPYESIAVIRPTSATVPQLYIDIVAIGRWK
jgi:hypothetical protein